MSLALLAAGTLFWNPNREQDLAGYNLYQGGKAETYTNRTVFPGWATNASFGLHPGTYFFTLTAFNNAGMESDFSNEVQCTEPWRLQIALCPPEGVSLSFETDPGQQYMVESSPFLLSWFGWTDRAQLIGDGTIVEISFPVQEEAEYFRVRTL